MKLQLNVGDKIKIGRREFEIKKGDYLLDNASCIQFIPGDRRTLFYIKIGRFNQPATSVQLPKKLVKKIDFDYLHKTPYENASRFDKLLTKYNFK